MKCLRCVILKAFEKAGSSTLRQTKAEPSHMIELTDVNMVKDCKMAV